MCGLKKKVIDLNDKGSIEMILKIIPTQLLKNI